jgi:hypothetical protein
MHRTIDVDAQACETRSITSAAARWPWPRPPTSLALIKPRIFSLANAAMAALGKAPLASISATAGSITSAMMRSRASNVSSRLEVASPFSLRGTSVTVGRSLIMSAVSVAHERGDRAARR